jgi:hypothetical protein
LQWEQTKPDSRNCFSPSSHGMIILFPSGY